MKPDEIAIKALDAIEKHDYMTLEQCFDDSLQFTGPVPIPLNKEQFISLMKGLTKGAPDWNFNRSNIEVKGNSAFVTVSITGTHSGELNLPIPGVPAIPATNKKFHIPQEVIEFTVNNDKITRITVPNVPGGGIPGMLSQLGIKMDNITGSLGNMFK